MLAYISKKLPKNHPNKTSKKISNESAESCLLRFSMKMTIKKFGNNKQAIIRNRSWVPINPAKINPNELNNVEKIKNVNE